MTNKLTPAQSDALFVAGQAVAANLVRRKYKEITINQTEDRYGNQIINRDFVSSVCKLRMKKSLRLPDEFGALFKADFIFMAGIVIWQKCDNVYDPKGAIREYKIWAEADMPEIPLKVSQPYQKFLFEYTYDRFSEEVIWSNVKSVAAELMKRKTLSRFQVIQVIINDDMKAFNSKMQEFDDWYSKNAPSVPEKE